MSELTTVEGMQSEIYVPITPKSIWTDVTTELKDMTVGLATAAGVHLKDQDKFNLAGDFSLREIPGDIDPVELMVTHGGYDQGDVNKDINCMFPIERMNELAKEGFIKGLAPVNVGFMGGGGDQDKFKNETGPKAAEIFAEHEVDAVLLTAG